MNRTVPITTNHESQPPAQYWYHGFFDGTCFIPIAGPFATREEADAVHDQAVRSAFDIDVRSWFGTWGTARLPNGDRAGVLNAQLGIVRPECLPGVSHDEQT